jgi:hypothetical protein
MIFYLNSFHQKSNKPPMPPSNSSYTGAGGFYCFFGYYFFFSYFFGAYFATSAELIEYYTFRWCRTCLVLTRSTNGKEIRNTSAFKSFCIKLWPESIDFYS